MSDLVLLAGGSVTMTHHVTGTYFMCNDWHDGIGNHTQTWAQDPFAKDNTSHRWFQRQNADGTVRIESYANRRCLTAGANPPDVVTLREGTDSLSQHWRLVSTRSGATTSTWSRSCIRAMPWPSPTTSRATTGWSV